MLMPNAQHIYFHSVPSQMQAMHANPWLAFKLFTRTHSNMCYSGHAVPDSRVSCRARTKLSVCQRTKPTRPTNGMAHILMRPPSPLPVALLHTADMGNLTWQVNGPGRHGQLSSTADTSQHLVRHLLVLVSTLRLLSFSRAATEATDRLVLHYCMHSVTTAAAMCLGTALPLQISNGLSHLCSKYVAYTSLARLQSTAAATSAHCFCTQHI